DRAWWGFDHDLGKGNQGTALLYHSQRSCANPATGPKMNERHVVEVKVKARFSKAMVERLNGYRILILESREEAQFSRLLVEQGADVLQCPMFAIHDVGDPAPVEAWIGRAIEKPLDDLVLMTGEGLRRLMKAARRAKLEQAFVAALRDVRK